MTSRRSGAAVLAAALLAVLTWWLLDSGTTTVGGAELRYDDGLPVVALDDLPPEAAATVELIDAGGPFPHEQDDETFFNREGLLPEAPAGHYREYTVETPGSDDRGARTARSTGPPTTTRRSPGSTGPTDEGMLIA